jgi:hypothetical protein
VGSSEFVNFAFAAPVIDLTYVVSPGESSGNKNLVGERRITVFGVGANLLGTFSLSGGDRLFPRSDSVSNLVSNTPIESFRLASPVFPGFDSFRVNSITFTQPQAIPFEFSPVGGLVILAGAWLGHKQFKKQSSK